VSSAAEDFRFFTQSLVIPERGVVKEYVLVLETNQFRFLAPPGWQVRYQAQERKCVLSSRDLAANISVSVLPAQLPLAQTAPEPALRKLAMDRYPGAKLLHEQACYAGTLMGVALDLEVVAKSGARLNRRVALVPWPGGTVEFCLAVPASRFREFVVSFANVLTSFRRQAWPPPENKQTPPGKARPAR
jgi:hypothetical protein